jgi:hypothetical protein
MKGKLILLMMAAIFLISLVSASEMIIKQNQNVDLKIPCINNATACSPSANCSLTVLFPNNTYLVNNQQMTNMANGIFNYTLDSNQTAISGIYATTMICADNGLNGYENFIISINPTGEDINTNKSNMMIGILIAIFGIAVLLGYLGIKMVEKDSIFPIGLFFLILSLILVIVELYLGFTYSQDIIYLSNITNINKTLFKSIMFSVVGIGIISLVLMLRNIFQILFDVVKKKKTRNSDGYGNSHGYTNSQ